MRNGFWQFVYDWQTLTAGSLALFAAGGTGWMLWRQLKDIARQATAADHQLILVQADALRRRVLAIENLRADINGLCNSIGGIELTKASEQDIELFREVRLSTVGRVIGIKRDARAIGIAPNSKATRAIEDFCRLAQRWEAIARKIERKLQEQPVASGTAALDHTRELQNLIGNARVLIDDDLQKADRAAQQAINDETAYVRSRTAQVNAQAGLS